MDVFVTFTFTSPIWLKFTSPGSGDVAVIPLPLPTSLNRWGDHKPVGFFFVKVKPGPKKGKHVQRWSEKKQQHCNFTK